MKFYVDGKKIRPENNFATIFVQHEVNPEEIQFVFTNSELFALKPFIYWENSNEEFDFEELTKTETEDGFVLTWIPSAAATSAAGHFVFNLSLQTEDASTVWKSYVFVTCVARDIDGDPINFEGNLETILHSFVLHMNDEDIHFADAPPDGKQYARKNGRWVQVTGGGGGTGGAVESVNGQIGEVVLNASDIETDSGATVEAELQLQEGRTTEIERLLPNQASEDNELADKEFVNSSISTNTANYISNEGEPFNSVEELEAYEGTITNNDYAFVTGTDENGNLYFDRYKATVSDSVSWAKEYRLNNSSFTAAQWSAIQSGITALLVNQITLNQAAITEIQTSLSSVLSQIASAVTSGELRSFNGQTVYAWNQSGTGAEKWKIENGKLSVPIANNGVLGVVDVRPAYGLDITNWGVLGTVAATNSELDALTNDRKVVVPKNLKYAIVTAIQHMTDSEKAEIKTALGL